MGNPDTSWLKEGAACVLFTPSNYGNRGGSVSARTVSRITQRDVVLDDGTRLRRDRMSIQRGRWEPDTRLLPSDHADVTAARRHNQWGSRRHAMSTAAEALSKAMAAGPSNVDKEISELRNAIALIVELGW